MPVPRRVLQFGALTLSAACCLGVAEWLWRAAVRADHAQRLARFDEPLFEAVGGAPYYRLRAGIDRTEAIVDPAGGPATVVRYRTQQGGLRAHPAWPPPAPAEAARILFVGDSYTFGTGVQDGESFPHQAQAELARLGVPSFAINAGVPGYDSEQELAHLQQLLPHHEPRFVVLGFAMNDAEPPPYVPLPPEFVYRGCRSWLFEDCKPWLNGLSALLVDDRAPWQGRKPHYERDYLRSWQPGHGKARAALAAIAAMHALCEHHRVGFLVVVLPDFTASFDDTYRFHGIHAQVAAFGRQAGFATIDALSDLRGSDAATLRVPGDGHPNAEGQRRLGAFVAKHLAESLRG